MTIYRRLPFGLVQGAAFLAACLCMGSPYAVAQKGPSVSIKPADAEVARSPFVRAKPRGRMPSSFTQEEAYYMDSGKYAEAIRLIIPRIQKDPNNAELRYKLADCYLKYGLTNKAMEELNVVVKLKPDYAPAHITLASIYERKGNLDLAVKELSEAARISPNAVELKYQLGKTYQQNGQKDKAVEEFRGIIQIDPSYYRASIAIADILVDKGDLENAAEELKYAAIFAPKNPEIHYKLGRLYMMQGNKNSALEAYRILKDMHPEYAQNLFVLIFPESK